MGVVTALLPFVMNLIGGLWGKSESDKTAEQISGLQSEMPAEALQAESLAREMSSMGLPGVETYKEQINQIVPSTLSAVKEVAQSPSQIIDLASKALTATNDAYNKLAVSDATARLSNMKNYQSVLENKANLASNIQSQNNQIQMAAIGQKAQGTSDLISGIERGVAGSISSYGQQQQNDYMKDYYDKISGFFDNSSQPTTTQLNPVNNTIPKVATFESTPSFTPTVQTPQNVVQLQDSLGVVGPVQTKQFTGFSQQPQQLQTISDMDKYVNDLIKQFGFAI